MPKVERVVRHEGTPWIQTIYQTQDVTDNNGSVPQTVVVRQLSEALDRIGIDHEIHYDFQAIEVTNERAYCGDPSAAVRRRDANSQFVDTGDWTIGDPGVTNGPILTEEDALPEFTSYLDGDAPKVAADSNLLLTNAPGGGCAYVGGNAGVAGARFIGNDPGQYRERHRGLWGECVRAALHEIGHNMGYSHADNAGTAFNDDENGVWWATPMARAGQTNRCEQQVPPQKHDDVGELLYYPDCVAQTIAIKDKDPLSPGWSLTPGQLALGAGGLGLLLFAFSRPDTDD